MRNASTLIINQVDRWGTSVVGIMVYTTLVLRMIYLSIRAAFFDQAQGLRTIFSVISAQIYFTGWQALPLISVLALASGSIVIMQSQAQLSLLGGGEMIGNLLVVIIVREISPMLTALIVIARSGTAVASELGNMRVNREIEALEIMGINPLSYVVFPRLVGGIISVLCLAFYFILIALLGGFAVTRLVDSTPFSFYADSLARAFSAEDVLLFLLKNLFSGAIIFTVSCYQGMLVQQSPHEVPQVTTKAVVNSVIYVTVFNLIVTTLFYLNQLMKLGVL
jgi:phospholipid/cholesterol/gamma-HCH transport system permease protein